MDAASRDPPEPERQIVVFWDEGLYQCRQGLTSDLIDLVVATPENIPGLTPVVELLQQRLSFAVFFLPIRDKLSGDNCWIKLTEPIPWNDLEDHCASYFCRALQRPQSCFEWCAVH